MDKQAEYMINNERAWIVVDRVSPPNIGPPRYGVVTNEFRFVIKNTGRTIARMTGPFRARFHLVAANETLPAVPDYEISNPGFASQDSPAYGPILAPGDMTGPIVELCYEQITPGIFEAISKTKSLVLYFYASFRYFDAADRKRETQFCYRYFPEEEGGSPAHWMIFNPHWDYNKTT